MAALRRRDLADDPFEQFARWMADAIGAGVPEPTAMVLATASPDGAPTARLVLLKGVEGGAFRFFTHYDSRKGHDLTANPRAALVFPWHSMQRQVRVTGSVTMLDGPASDAYFAGRPRGAQLGAWASRQSQPLAGREALDEASATVTTRYAGGAVPRPPWWGGYAVHADSLEFWQGREDRLHDRFRYGRSAAGPWSVRRLAP